MTAGVEHVSESELVIEYTNAKKEYGDELEKMIQDVVDLYANTSLKQAIYLLRSACKYAVKSKKIE